MRLRVRNRKLIQEYVGEIEDNKREGKTKKNHIKGEE